VDTVDAVAVADHVNLTWRSPLAGPNDDRFGPRFPVVAGMYDAGLVRQRLSALPGLVTGEGVVAGVRDMSRLSGFEQEMIRRWGMGAVTSELVPVALVAAHLGFRLAAVVVIAEWDPKKE
jgi:purine nucleoside phosphorylase